MIAAVVRFSVRNAGLVLAIAGAVLIFGIVRMLGASLDVFPEFSPTQVVIQTESPGLSSGLVETLVTNPVEQAIGGVAGLQSIRSQSIPGLSVVTAIFADGSDIYRNRQLVAERLTQAASQLPHGITPTITPLTSSASTVLGVGVTSKTRSALELRSLVDWTIRPHLLAVPGVADINVFGGKVRQWQILVDPLRLAQAGLSLPELASAARQVTGVRGAGVVESANQRIGLTLESQAGSADELGRSVIGQRGNRPLLLGEVADVVEGPAPSISGAQINGEPGVFLFIQGQLGANTRDTTFALERALAEIRPLLDREHVTLHPDLFRPANFIETAVGNVRQDVAIGASLVIAVLFLFLYNARTALVSAVAIPLSLIAAVLVLQAAGMSLNIMVLGGLAIALGEVVDDAIIDCENIFRRLRENRLLPDPAAGWKVVFDASMEVRSSVVYATFIVALVFVPLLTLSGVAGKLFAPLGLAYISAILASLLVAITVTPAMSYLLLAGKPLPSDDPPLIAWLKPYYRRALLRIEKRPTAVFVAVTLTMAAGIGLLPLFGGEFIPPLKEGHFIVHMTAIPGTSETESLRLGRRVAEELLKTPGVKSVAQWVGRAQNGADTFGPHYSEFEVEIGQLSGSDQRRILQDIRRTLSSDDGDEDKRDEQAARKPGFVGLHFAVNTFLTERIGETVTGYPADIVVSVFGAQLDALDRDAQAVARLMATTPGARDTQVLAPPGAPELSIRLRFDKLALQGLSPGEVMDALQIAYEGLAVGQIYRESSVTPVTILLDPRLRRDVSQVSHLPLRTPDGRAIELRDVADIAIGQGRYKILHAGGRRLQTVTCNIARGHDAETYAARLKQRIAAELTPAPGNYIVLSGAAEAQQRARSDLLWSAMLACVGVAALLLLAFRSLRNLALTFANLPFALIGGVIAVLATGGWMTLGSVVGFVTLFGITLRNSIMLVSHFQHLVEIDGLQWNLDTAIRGALERLPSILMTALVTGLGLAPLALGSAEPGREIEGPMATIIVGGLVSSTLLNLLVLPTVLLHFGRFQQAAD